MRNEKRIAALGVLSDYLVSCIPADFQSRDDVVSWLESSPYSPYIALYGGENSLDFNEHESFVSAVDSKRRYMLQDEITFKFENFYNIDNEIVGANSKLSNIISAKNLFMAYPDFGDIDVSIHISQANNSAMSGTNYYKENRIEVFASSNEDAMRVLLHELQHSIQAKEGFALGESYYQEDGIMNAVVLENRYLDKNGKVDENLILEDGVGRLPKYVTSFEKFEKLFKNKINVRYTSIETPIGAISVHLRNAFKHLTSNTNYENRIKYSGGFISVFSDPLFVVKDTYNGKDIRIFYKPMISKNKTEGLLHFVGYGINDRGEIENSTYFDVKASKLERYIKTAEENLLFYKYAGSNCFRSVSPNLELGNTHTCDRILSEKKDDVKVSFKEDQKERLKEWHRDSHTLTKKDDGSPKVFYHGTNVDFSEFNREKARAGWLSKGFYFTNELIEAKDYGSRIIASYITLKNPFVIKGDIVQADGTVEWAKSTKEQFVEALPHVENFKIEDASRHLENIGYDGIINAAHIVAFSPSQIKSIHNRGTFEENNSNIFEKNDFGLKKLEKALSIVRTGAAIESVSRYLSYCGLSLENAKNSVFADSFSKDSFVNPFSFNKGLVDKESDYYKNAGEREAREVEDMYVSIAAAIKVDDEFLKMSDEQRESAINNLFVSPDKSLDVVV